MASPSNEVPNIYKSIPKKFIKKYHNPHYEDHKLNHPFRMVIVGASGAGKTQLVVHILSKMRNTFANVYIYTKNKDEPIYQYLEEKIPSGLTIKEGLDELPTLQKDKNGVVKGFEKDDQSLVIFDDLVLEKSQERIEQMFIRGRKIAGGISIMYLTQSYFKVPKTIRINCTYIILKKLASTRDLNMILSDYNLGVSKDTLLEIYKYCTRIKEEFLLLDLDSVPEHRFRRNLLEIINIETFDPKKPAPVSSKNEVKKIEEIKSVEPEFKQVSLLETKDKAVVHNVDYT
jgi:ABC-type dipeptide/oligopeptide/nickel transport system ATPase component